MLRMVKRPRTQAIRWTPRGAAGGLGVREAVEGKWAVRAACQTAVRASSGWRNRRKERTALERPQNAFGAVGTRQPDLLRAGRCRAAHSDRPTLAFIGPVAERYGLLISNIFHVGYATCTPSFCSARRAN